mgnify:CR=1 FL=1
MGIHELERLLIGGLLKYKHDAFSQIEGKIGPKFFSNPREHQNIFSTIVDAIQKKEFFDPTTIARQLIAMGISNVKGCPVLDYLESVSLTTVQKRAIPAYAQTIFENCQLTDAQKNAEKTLLTNSDILLLFPSTTVYTANMSRENCTYTSLGREWVSLLG